MEASCPPAKRKRLSHACTRCRTKKIRCDELQPRCTNCMRASVDCITFDPRTLASAPRREAQRQPAASSPSTSNRARAASSTFGDAEATALSPHDVLVANVAESSPAESSPLLPVLPRFLTGNSLSVLTQWLDLAFARLGMTHRLHRTYNEIRAREQRPTYANPPLNAVDVRDSLPTYAQSKSALSISLGHVFPIFGVKQQDPTTQPSGSPTSRPTSRAFRPPELLEAVDEDELSSDTLTPLYALTHALGCIASNSDANRKNAERCFRYAFGQLPTILEATQPLDSVRAFVLMSLYFRWRNDLEKAWQLLSLAVATVQNHGLHREQRTPLPESQDVFWCVFVLDKLLSVELERKPLLSSKECNRPTPSISKDCGGAIFRAIVEFSKLQDEILERLLLSRREEEAAHELQNQAGLNHIVKEKLRLVAELDHKLLQFADGLNHGLKPTEYLYADPESLSGVTFLAVQFYQAVFLVSRNALLINMSAVQVEIHKNVVGLGFSNRLKSGMHVCANAARSILNILNHAHEMGVQSPLFTPYAPTMAMYALTIHIVRRHSVATARVDLELQATAMNLIKNHMSLQHDIGEDSSSNSGLIQMLESLLSFSESYIHQSAHSQQIPSNVPINTNSIPAAGSINQWRPGEIPTRVISPPQSPANLDAATRGTAHVHSLPIPTATTSVPGQQSMVVTPSAFSDDWFMNMGGDAMSIDWDELAMALGLPTGQR